MRLLPLFVVLCVIPKLITVVARIRNLDCGGHGYVIDLETVARVVLECPLKEELLFRGIPYLLAGTEGLVMGTVMWYLGHVLYRLRSYDAPSESIPAVLSYALASYFYTYAWISAHSLIPVLYHMLGNALGLVFV